MLPRYTVFENKDNNEAPLKEHLLKNILYLCQMTTSQKIDKNGNRIDPKEALISIDIPFKCTSPLDTSVSFNKTISRLIEYKAAEKISSFNLSDKSDENTFAFQLLLDLTGSIENEVEDLKFIDISRLSEAFQEQPPTLFTFPLSIMSFH